MHKNNLLALLTGLLLPLAFAPFRLFIFAILSPALLFLLLRRAQTVQQATALGFYYGISFFGFGMGWIYISIHQYGGASSILALFLTALMVCFFACYTALLAFVLCRYFDLFSRFTLFAIFPSTWILLEWIRSFFLTGFPWLLLGQSQTNTILSGYLPLLGTYGTGFIILLLSAFFIGWFDQKRLYHLPSLLGILSLFIIGGILTTIPWTRPYEKPITVSLVQGNISQSIKWDPEYLQHSLNQYWMLTETHWHDPLIVWPEAAIPIPLKEATVFVTQLQNKVRENHSTLITGIPIESNIPDLYHNGAIQISDNNAQYAKQHLVPFGEFVPLEKWLRGLIAFFDLPMSNFVSGKSNQPLFLVKNSHIAAFICYEIAYSNIVRQTLPSANLLLTLSNDAWFDDSIALSQHLQIAETQAKQTGRPLLFVANTGITATIDARGHIIKQLPINTPGTLTDRVQPMQGKTPWVLFGDLPVFLICAVLMALGYRRHRMR